MLDPTMLRPFAWALTLFGLYFEIEIVGPLNMNTLLITSTKIFFGESSQRETGDEFVFLIQ